MSRVEQSRWWSRVSVCLVALASGAGAVSCSSAPSAPNDEAVGTSQQALTAPAWQPGQAYQVGDLVSYEGKIYRVVQAHTSQTDWNPATVTTLYEWEGDVTGPPTFTTPPAQLTIDYVAGVADCNNSPESCCAPGSTFTPLTASADVYSSTQPNRCVASAQGNDTVYLQSSGSSSLLLGLGDDTAMDGPGDDLIWGGYGRDTINGHGGTNLFFGSFGDDTILAANGTNSVVPGPGLDIASLGTGDDEIYIFDVCEIVAGEQIAGGSGFDTLYSPVSEQELATRGVVLSSIEKIVVVDGHCNSECADRRDCGPCFLDSDQDGVPNCRDECWNDPNKSEAGVCGCGKPDTDSDGDRVPNCLDQCAANPNDAYAGDCGCLGESNLATAGTPCADSVARGVFACTSQGICGNPTSVAPLPGCVLKTVRARAYWICDKAAVGGGRTLDEAAALCDLVEGRQLLQIDSAEENALLAKLVDGPSWIGAVDRTTEGSWFWLDVLQHEKTRFWNGGASGRSVDGKFTRWENRAPVTDSQRNCATIDRDGRWRAASCATAESFVCENTFGPLVTPGGTQGVLNGNPTSLRPQGIVPGWNDWEKENGPGGVSDIDPALCTHLPPRGAPRDGWRAQAQGELTTCDATCAPDADPAPNEGECDAACTGTANPPPSSAPACTAGAALTNLDFIVPGGCQAVDPITVPGNDEQVAEVVAAAQDCSEFGPLSRCGSKTSCYHMVSSGGSWKAETCSSSDSCDVAGHTCVEGKCVDPAATHACHYKDGERCVGQCFATVGCGFNFEDLFPWKSFGAQQPCAPEVRYCSENPRLEGGFAQPELAAPENFDPATELPPDVLPPGFEAYSNDFADPGCEGPGDICFACQPPGSSATPEEVRAYESCQRASRHSWCNYDAVALPSGRDHQDDREANRGDASSSTIEFKVDPVADIDFRIEQLPFGLAKFDVSAAAALKADVAFDVGLGIAGRVEIANIRAQMVASLCRVSTKDSRMEVLGVDFLPGLANDAIFDTDDLGFDGEECEEAVLGYIDAVDRAKKAFRDAQDLITQYKGLQAAGRTFGPNFCTEIFGNGPRPAGFEGACPESPEVIINRFIDFYVRQLGVPAQGGQAATGIYAALDHLMGKVIDTNALETVLGKSRSDSFAFSKRITDMGDKKTVTLIAMQFFIGPVPAVLEVQSYLEYSINGAFGASLDPRVLLHPGGGSFAKAGVEVIPKVSSGVTLFVGVGFNIGPLALAVGIEGGVTLAEASIPATVAAGLSMVPSADRGRELPPDLLPLSAGRALYPPGGLQKYDVSFDVDYGMTLHLSNMLGGYLDGAIKITFFFFSQKFSQRLAEFEGFSPPPIKLLNGGVEMPLVNGLAFWRPQFPSVPFVDLAKLPTRDLNTTLVEDASYDATVGKQLFYDHFCTCREDDQPCQNNAECCSGICDGEEGNKTCGEQCSGRGEPCSTTSDCCSNGVCNNGTCTFIN